jgi:hypothetical protein
VWRLCFSRARWRPEQHLELMGAVSTLLQQLTVISSDRDARLLDLLALLAGHYVRRRTGCSTRAGRGPSPSKAPGEELASAKSALVPVEQGTTICSHCQLDPAVMRCLSESCGRGVESSSFMCEYS